MFPSPVGELHFSISRKEINYEKIYYYVSVPCRGTTFLNDNFGTEAVTGYCFRPLSGNYISQFEKAER